MILNTYFLLTIHQKLIVELEYIDISPDDFTLIKHD
jgi:hypothetical protein